MIELDPRRVTGRQLHAKSEVYGLNHVGPDAVTAFVVPNPIALRRYRAKPGMEAAFDFENARKVKHGYRVLRKPEHIRLYDDAVGKSVSIHPAAQPQLAGAQAMQRGGTGKHRRNLAPETPPDAVESDGTAAPDLDAAYQAAASAHGPRGKPVSEGLDWGQSGIPAKWKSAQQSIDAVHGDGDLPRLPVAITTWRNLQGEYVVGTDGKPKIMLLSDNSQVPGLTKIHETGHFIDHQALGATSQFESRNYQGDLQEVLQLINQSAAMDVLRDLSMRRSQTIRYPDGTKRRHWVRSEYVNYLMRPEELWARAYTQYIAVRSQHPELLSELDWLRRTPVRGIRYPRQWSDEEFEPIAAAIDRLFLRKGWIRDRT